MLKRKILLIGGKIKSGKDYISDKLVRNGGWVKFALADPLKKITAEMYNIDIKHFKTQEGKTKLYIDGRTYRKLLIDTATQLKRTNKHYFTDLLIRRINEDDTTKDIVISDFRYPYEYERLNQKLGPIFEIQTMKIVRKESENLEDPSETSLQDFVFDYTYLNNNSLSDYFYNASFSIFR
jgi:phosphomevalonate kinase